MIKLKELLSETSISMGQVHSNPYAHSFKSPEEIKSVDEELYNSQGEEIKFKKGDLVKDINPDCPHYGSRGEVKKVGKGTITFVVSNNGKNYQQGDELEKTVDQMIKIKESVNEKVARPFSEHLRKAQDEIEYMISQGPLEDEGVYDKPGQAMKLLQTAQKALGKIK